MSRLLIWANCHMPLQRPYSSHYLISRETRAGALNWASWATPRIDAMTMSIRVVMNIIAVTSGIAAYLSGNPVCDQIWFQDHLTIVRCVLRTETANNRVPCKSPNARYTPRTGSNSIEFEISCTICMGCSVLHRQREDSPREQE